AVNAICDISSSSHPRRELVFQGLLTIRRFSQLSLLTGQLDQLIRIDPFGVLPCVLSLKVSKRWKALADDDIWRGICEQYIGQNGSSVAGTAYS
ncbi:hypothetical protein M405DRAFT_803310, partial [Rhizopogon salebrosus TDB-379]